MVLGPIHIWALQEHMQKCMFLCVFPKMLQNVNRAFSAIILKTPQMRLADNKATVQKCARLTAQKKKRRCRSNWMGCPIHGKSTKNMHKCVMQVWMRPKSFNSKSIFTSNSSLSPLCAKCLGKNFNNSLLKNVYFIVKLFVMLI